MDSLTYNVPKIRFSQFKDPWNNVKLNEVLDESKELNKQLQYTKSDVLSVSSNVGIVNQLKYKGRSFAGESVANYSIVKEGYIVYTKSPLKEYPYGIIRVNKGDQGIVSTLYAVYKTNSKISGKFLDYYFQLPDHTNKYLRPLVHKGAKNDMKINNQRVLIDKIFIPKTDEQQKIASFLSAVDKKIELLTRKKELLEQYKKGVMQKIFSQEIRFKDEDGKDFPDWEEKQLVEIAKRETTKNRENKVNHVLTNSATRGVVNQQDYFDKDIANQSNLKGYYIVSLNDFVYNPRISVQAPVGPIKRNKNREGVMSPLYTVFRFNDDNLDFYEFFFETSTWHRYLNSVANFGARHDRMNIANSDFYKMPIPYPCKDERKKISDFLNAITSKIEFTDIQLEKTKTFKKGLLQQMFV